MTMHAILCNQHGGPDAMQYVEVARPQPAKGEILIQTEAIGVNYVDTMRRSGKHPTAPKPPFTPGIELCGRVVELGENVDTFKEGARVIARCVSHGAYAEYVCAEAHFTIPCPENMNAEDAAAIFVNGQTAYHALVTMGQTQPDENVLITAAAGGVGVCAVQIAKISGARVVAAASNAEKLSIAEQFGADVLIDYSLTGWAEKVMSSTGGNGANVILESVGGDIFQNSLKCWAERGRLVVFGKASGTPGTVTGDELLFGHRTAYGLAVGKVIENEEVLQLSMQQLFDWYEDGKFKLLIGHKFLLSEAAKAHRLLEGRGSHGKIVLLP